MVIRAGQVNTLLLRYTNMVKGMELDVKSVCTTNVIMALSFIWQYIYNKSVLYTAFEFIIWFGV